MHVYLDLEFCVLRFLRVGAATGKPERHPGPTQRPPPHTGGVLAVGPLPLPEKLQDLAALWHLELPAFKRPTNHTRAFNFIARWRPGHQSVAQTQRP